jgi:Ca2+-binding EF-hand superfamily protein
MMSLNLISQDINLLRHEFEAIDRDKNGKLSFAEIKEVLATKLSV